MLDHILPWEARKEDPLEEEAISMQRKWVLENGFHQKRVCDENDQNTKSKAILIEMNEGEL